MPTPLDSLFSTRSLSAALDAGHVTRVRHPELGLSLYAYTRQCQYDHAWTNVTTRCRGLVVSDADNTVVAWPLRRSPSWKPPTPSRRWMQPGRH